jgi:hypothetical protein
VVQSQNFDIVATHAVNGDESSDFINRREGRLGPLDQHGSSAVFAKHRFDLLTNLQVNALIGAIHLGQPSGTAGTVIQGETCRWLRTKPMTCFFDKFRKTCIISDMRTSEAIRQAIAAKPDGAVFSAADLRLAGTRAAIDQALWRMMRAGVIVRVARGLYALVGQSVDAQTVARAVAQKTGERVGLAPNAESNDELVAYGFRVRAFGAPRNDREK